MEVLISILYWGLKGVCYTYINLECYDTDHTSDRRNPRPPRLGPQDSLWSRFLLSRRTLNSTDPGPPLFLPTIHCFRIAGSGHQQRYRRFLLVLGRGMLQA